MAEIRVFNPSGSTKTQTERGSPMKRKVGNGGTGGSSTLSKPLANNPAAVAGAAIAEADALRKENAELKKKVESQQDLLDEIADVASASPDGDEDADELAEKLDTIIDLAAPGSADDDAG